LEIRMGPSAARTLSVLAVAIAYLGLAIAGWGGISAYFSHPALTALSIAFCAVAAASLFCGRNISPGVREDRGNRWVLAAFGILGLLNGFLPAWTDRIGFWTIDGDTVRWLGVAIFVVSGYLRLWPVVVLGNRFSGLVAIQPEHALVTDGIYSVIRHPSYVGLILNSLGWSLAFRSGVGVLVTALMLPPMIARIYAEEALLRSQFGAEYDAFRVKTRWRLIPGAW
jgi:protein-S-isoprenylcysteine O-methyltransferase Ste14